MDLKRQFLGLCLVSKSRILITTAGLRLNYQSPFPNFFYVGAASGMPGFASGVHFATLLYERLTGDRVP